MRREGIRNLNITEKILSLSDVSESLLCFYPPQLTSNLNEMQRLFAKLKI
jgi:hypothetical protein